MSRSALVMVLGAAAFACGGGDLPAQTPPPPPPIATPAPSVADLVVAPTASAAPPAPPSLSAFDSSALDSRKAADTARSLAQEVGPRLAGSANDKLAVAWALKTMTAAGLSNVHAEPVTAPVWKRGAESAEIVSPVHQSLAITALGWSGATPKDGVNAEVIEVDSLEALSKLPKGSAKGKIIFGNVVMKKSIDGKGYGDAVPMRLAGPRRRWTRVRWRSFCARSALPKIVFRMRARRSCVRSRSRSQPVHCRRPTRSSFTQHSRNTLI